jgi:hypothetical protein
MENTQAHNTGSMPRDVFLYLLNIFTFYVSVISFITVFIQYINVLFPDPLNFYYTGITNAIRLCTSILVIAVPVYILTSWILGKDFKKNHEKRELKLRKWLLYFTLFISAVTVIIDLIIFVYNFFSGELTVRFLLKIIVVLFVAAAVFGYYIWDLKRKDKETSQIPKRLSWAVSFLVLASIVLGFFIIGTPKEQRARRFDEQRVTDLQMMQDQLINYWLQKEELPQDLSQLEDSISGFIVPKDPETAVSYEYNVINNLSFEFCAVFKTLSKDFGSVPARPIFYGDFYQQNWAHEVGRTCFQRTIDPDLYKKTLVPEPVRKD